MTDNENKLYVVTRRDLSPGYQIVQSCHAVENLARYHPDEVHRHGDLGDTMVVLAAKNELELLVYHAYVASHAKTSIFWEPDISEYTAFAVAPFGRPDLLSRLPLAGRDLRRKRWWNR